MTELTKTREMACFGDQVRRCRYQISEHVLRSVTAGHLNIADIEMTLLDGRILEEHRHETRGTSYLVCGVARRKPVHVLCAEDGTDWLVILFAYIPAPPIWKNALTRNDRGDRIMREKLKTCFFCAGAIKDITVANFDYRLEGQLYVIKKVPAGLCEQCGEKYLATEVARHLNDLIENNQFVGTETVQVVEYGIAE